MLRFELMLAQSGDADGFWTNRMTAGAWDGLMLLGALLLVVLLVLIWAVFLRQRRHRHRSRHRRSGEVAVPIPSAAESRKEPFSLRRRKRRHSEYLSRNPTLAETGGLPPLRQDDSSNSPLQS